MDEKIWWKSRGVWGGRVAMLAGIAAALGYSLSEGVQGDIVELILGSPGWRAAAWPCGAASRPKPRLPGRGGIGTEKPGAYGRGRAGAACGMRGPGNAGCAGSDTSRYQAVAAQLPGVVEALADVVALTAPWTPRPRRKSGSRHAGQGHGRGHRDRGHLHPVTVDRLHELIGASPAWWRPRRPTPGRKSQVANYAACGGGGPARGGRRGRDDRPPGGVTWR